MNYEEIYELFRDVTPLKEDCGLVCGGACCRCDETGETLGMRLFPAEPCRLNNAQVLPTENGERLVVCGGRCCREERPLSCRIFPLFPYVTPQGTIKAVYDPRAFRVCPLIQHAAHVPLRREFVRSVRKAGRLLMRDAACRAFLQAQSREIDEFNAFLRLEQERAPICRRKR